MQFLMIQSEKICASPANSTSPCRIENHGSTVSFHRNIPHMNVSLYKIISKIGSKVRLSRVKEEINK